MPKVREVESLVQLCTDCIQKSIEKIKFPSDVSATKREGNTFRMSHPIYELIKSICKLSVSCIKITIECRKCVPDLSTTIRESNAINVNSEMVSDPFHKLLESILKLCSCYIKKTIENKKFAFDLSAATKKKDDTIILSSEETKNPFPQLPVPLLEKLVGSLTSGRKLTHKNILEQIITSQLQHLSFSQYSESYLLNLFPKLENLLVLNLEDGEIGNDCLKSIGTYCSKLRWLNVTRCVKVTDSGIQWLCGEADYPEIGNEKSGLCETLKRLDLICTSVTQRGIQMALTHLLSLEIINHYDTLEALVKLAQSAVVSKRVDCCYDKFSASVLHTSPNKPYLHGSLQVALSMCNLLTRITIYATKGLKDSDLLCLIDIKVLRGLKILRSDSNALNEITFDGGVCPLLKVVGNSLEAFGTDCFDSIRIPTIAELCPNLTAIYFNNIRGMLQNELNLLQMEKNPTIFKKLTYVQCVWSFPSDILLFLLSSPLLEDIQFFYCQTLTDEVLRNAANFHGFHKLEILDLRDCNVVSEYGINALLVENIPLKKIIFKSCKNLGSKTHSNWLSLIRQKNWNLKCFFFK